MHKYLKVKSVSLALEAKYIRKQEQIALSEVRKSNAVGKDKRAAYFTKLFNGLADHRKGIVRNEARLSNIAYGFCRGHAYRDIEKLAYSMPDFVRIADLVSKYHEADNPKYNRPIVDRWEQWLTEAMEYIVSQPIEDPEKLQGFKREVFGPLPPKKPYDPLKSTYEKSSQVYKSPLGIDA